MKRVLMVLLLTVVPMMGFSLFESDKGSDKEYLHLVSSVKDVVVSTQKTRGLTNSFMNGNVTAQLLVFGQREQMLKDFERIQKALKEAKTPEAYVQEADALMKQLKVLNKKAFKRDSAEVFADYTSVIEAWIALNGKIIDSQFKSGDEEIYLAVSTLNNTLLPLTENIGKLRGMGSGIVARHVCQPEETPKMQRFVSNIEMYRIKMKAYLQKHALQTLSKAELAEINQKIADYTTLTQEEVIGREEITLDANKFFDQGTACIGGVLRVYSALESDIMKKL